MCRKLNFLSLLKIDGAVRHHRAEPFVDNTGGGLDSDDSDLDLALSGDARKNKVGRGYRLSREDFVIKYLSRDIKEQEDATAVRHQEEPRAALQQ